MNFSNHLNWLNSSRNKKFITLNIDWKATYDYLNSDECKTVTSFDASSAKSKKVHILAQELPTREQLKKSRPDIFKDHKCPLCNTFNETFTHIWMCSHNKPLIQQLFADAKIKLGELLDESSDNKKKFYIDDSFWNEQYFINFFFSDHD